MNCNYQIHNEWKSMGESTCPFCEKLTEEVNKVVEPCCSEQNMGTVNGMNIYV